MNQRVMISYDDVEGNVVRIFDFSFKLIYGGRHRDTRVFFFNSILFMHLFFKKKKLNFFYILKLSSLITFTVLQFYLSVSVEQIGLCLFNA